MPEKTGLEQMEETASTVFGNPTAVGGQTDKSMLEMTDTNRWVYDSEQSELLIALQTLYHALVTSDNKFPQAKRIQDDAGKWSTVTVTVDNWKWLLDIITQVKTNQLTIQAFSRMQHLRQSAAMANIVDESEPKSFLARLFGG